MAKDKHGFDKRAKYKVGTLLRHKKYGFIVKLIGKDDNGWRRKLEFVSGVVPPNTFTFYAPGEPGATGTVAPCTLNMQYEELGPGAKILFCED